MLQKSSRLGVQKVIQVQKKGSRYGGGHFNVNFLTDTPITAFGVAAPKSGSVTSVNRNRLRRQVYALLREDIIPRLRFPTQALVHARKSAYTLKYDALKSELEKLFQGAGLIKK